MLREEFRHRLADPRREFGAGQARTRELERGQASLRETLLRSSCAVQVLEEMLADARVDATRVIDGTPRGTADEPREVQR